MSELDGFTSRLAVILALTCANCGLAPDTPKPANWPGILVLPDQSAAIYGFEYEDAPPAGMRVFVLFDAECGNSHGSSFDSRWHIGLRLPAAALGTYQVADGKSTAQTTAVAHAWIERLETHQSIEAFTGSVTLESIADSSSEFRSGTLLALTGTLNFLSMPSTEVNCSETVDRSGAVLESYCNCASFDGGTTSCVATEMQPHCCKSTSETTLIPYALKLVARPCPDLCAFPTSRPDLARYCEALR